MQDASGNKEIIHKKDISFLSAKEVSFEVAKKGKNAFLKRCLP